jgi:hypothetical protein
MNRTRSSVALAIVLAVAAGVARAQDQKPEAAAQPDPIAGIVQAMQQAEQRAASFRIELQTSGRLPDGTEFQTSGQLDVLRGAQPRSRTAVEFTVLGTLRGRMATAQTDKGIVVYHEDPAFGEVFYRIDPETVTDLEWAGEVLASAKLPGMKDRRAGAPLGSAMLDELRRHFVLTVTDKKARNGEAGQWLAGDRRPGLPDADADLPLATRVELFVRDKDKALLEVVHHQADKVLQRIEVKKLEVDAEIPAEAFTVDGNGQRLREVRQYLPMWGQIQDVLKQAEAKAAEEAEAKAKIDGKPVEAVVRPSKRK